MIRESLAPGSKYVFMGLTGANGYRWSRRNTTDTTQSSTNYGTGTAPNFWVRLVRAGNTFTGYTGTDGTTWTVTTTTSAMTMASNVCIGLAVNSGSLTSLNTSQFDNVYLVGGVSPAGSFSTWAASNRVRPASDFRPGTRLVAGRVWLYQNHRSRPKRRCHFARRTAADVLSAKCPPGGNLMPHQPCRKHRHHETAAARDPAGRRPIGCCLYGHPGGSNGLPPPQPARWMRHGRWRLLGTTTDP